MTRTDRWILGALVALMLACLPWTVHPFYDPMRDGAMYAMSARSLLAGEGYSYLGTPMVARPPGFPLMLVPLVAAAGIDFLAINLFVALWGVLAVALTFLLARQRVGPWVAAAACAAIWLNPAWQRSCSQIMSDVPGVALMMLALLMDGWARRRGTRGAHALLGLVLAAGVYVRTINALLLPAIVLGRWAGRGAGASGWRPLAWTLLIPVLAYAPWVVRNGSADVPTPTEQVYIHSYATALLHADAGDPESARLTAGELVERARRQVERVALALGNRGVSEDPSAGTFAALAVGLAAWLAALARRRRASEIFAGGALVVLALYFGFRPRLLLPVWILMFLTAVESGERLLERALPRVWARRALAAAVLVFGALDFDPWSWRPSVAGNHAQLAEVTDYLEEAYPESEAFAAVRGWDYGVFLERPVYGLRLVANRRGAEAVWDLIVERGVGALVEDTEGMGVGPVLAGMRERFSLERSFGRYRVYRVVD